MQASLCQESEIIMFRTLGFPLYVKGGVVTGHVYEDGSPVESVTTTGTGPANLPIGAQIFSRVVGYWEEDGAVTEVVTEFGSAYIPAFLEALIDECERMFAAVTV